MPDFDLVDTGQVIFDGILGRDDLAVRAVQSVQGSVEGGGFPRSGRSGHEENTIRTLNEAGEVLEVAIAEAELLDPDLDVVFIEKSHNGGLSVVGRDDRDTQVEFFFADGNLDPTVLGAASFGDVHFGENLDPGEDGSEQPSRWAVAFDQDTVDPVSDADAVFERLDVDIGCPKLNGFLNHQVH